MASSRRSKEVSFTISNHPEMHPDLKKANQNDFWAHVKSVLATRKSGRNKKGGPQLPTFIKNEYDIQERKMTASDVKREARLKNKYDKSEMKANFIKKYGKKLGLKYYFAAIRKQAMQEEYEDELNEAKLSRTEKRRIRQEKQKGKSKGAVHAFDVDETLFSHGVRGRPNVQVHVKDASGNRVKSLTNQQFNTYKLEPGHSYDFSEFRSAKKFGQTAAPNRRVIKKLKRLQRRGKNVHLITARAKFDNPDEFRRHFTRHGINISPGNIHYTGGMRGDSDIGKKKVAVAKGIAKMGKSSSIHMYDDAAKVHQAFEAEKKRNRRLRIKTHLAQPNEKGEVMTRSYQATKEDFELWIQNVLEEGYDLSDLTIDELYDIYEELIEDESEYSRIPYVSPYKSINESVEEESELSPYDYWKNFIVEEEDEDDEEDEDEDDDELEEEVELTPYELWKLYALQKNIQEQGEGEEEDNTSYNVTADQIKKRQKRQRKRQIAANLRDAADEVERD